ncbi:hypothetical protein MIDIC_470040 [Alphaproteobacteria bacterium]
MKRQWQTLRIVVKAEYFISQMFSSVKKRCGRIIKNSIDGIV